MNFTEITERIATLLNEAGESITNVEESDSSTYFYCKAGKYRLSNHEIYCDRSARECLASYAYEFYYNSHKNEGHYLNSEGDEISDEEFVVMVANYFIESKGNRLYFAN
jgi:hypothetical protein